LSHYVVMSSPIRSKLQTPSSLPGLTSLSSSFDTTSLYHFDAAERAPSTASKADVMRLNYDVLTSESGHSPTRSGCLLWAISRHPAPLSPDHLFLEDLRGRNARNAGRLFVVGRLHCRAVQQQERAITFQRSLRGRQSGAITRPARAACACLAFHRLT
jgi:hypothetical protein